MPRVIVHTQEPAGGLAWYVSEFVVALAKAGTAVILCCPANFEYEVKVREAGGQIVPAAVREVSRARPFARVLRNFNYAVRTTLDLFRLVRRGDVVHIESTTYPFGWICHLAPILRGALVVVTAHDPVPHRWRFPRALHRLERIVLQLSYRFSDAVVVHNETGKNALVRHFGHKAECISVIPHGPYCTTAADSQAACPTLDCLRLLAFGSIRENKGLHLAIRAVQTSASDFPVPVYLTIAGALHNADERVYWQKCQQLIAGQPDNIEVIERHIGDHEVGALMARHHAVILPYTEFFSESGVANLALSHQRPILAIASGGLRELIEQVECGIPIAHPTVEAVSSAIGAAIHLGPDRLHRMGIAGSKFIRKTRSWDSIAQLTLELYSKLTNDRGAVPPPTRRWRSGSHSKVALEGSRSLRLCKENHGYAVLTADIEGDAETESWERSRNRILIVVTTLAIGGAEAQVVRLAGELKARGCEISIVCLVKPTNFLEELERQRIPVYSLDMKAGAPDVRAIFRLSALIRRFRPDVVHCHMFHANILGRITRLFCRIPALICTAHSTRESSRQGGPTWHKELLYRATDYLADRTTIICEAGFDRYVRVRAVPRKKLRLIPNGIDTDVFSHSPALRERTRQELNIGTDFVWLAVGRLVPAKDYSTLFRAVELLGRKDLLIIIAGNGPLEPQLRQECDRRGLRTSVRFYGAQEDIRSLYNAADAFVMSSILEGLSLALMEAASMGLPAVVTNVGGNPEIVVENLSGYIVPPGNPVELATAMLRLMETTPERRAEMSRAARHHCRERYRIGAVVDQWLDLYADCLPARQAVLVA